MKDEQWMDFVMGMAKTYKDKYGEWCFDIETVMDDSEEDQHFEEDLFKV